MNTVVDPLRFEDRPGALPPQLPHNVEAEQELLGAILVNNDAYQRVAGSLKAEHFFDPLHARIYEVAASMIAGGQRVTPITLKTFFDGDMRIGPMTLPQYLARLAAEATTIVNAPDFGQVIYDLAMRRQAIVAAEALIAAATDCDVDGPGPAVMAGLADR